MRGNSQKTMSEVSGHVNTLETLEIAYTLGNNQSSDSENLDGC